MMETWEHPIWQNYRTHGDIDAFRTELLNTPWYLPPLTVEDSLLIRALQALDLPAIRVLIEVGESVALPADDGLTLLHIGVDVAGEVRENHLYVIALEILETLINAGADPNVIGVDGTPLHRAAGWGIVPTAEKLLDLGADIDARTTEEGEMTPLMYAALLGQVNMVRFLLDHGADVDARSAQESGALTAEQMVVEQNAETAADVLEVFKELG
jgi:uncharacterized protein